MQKQKKEKRTPSKAEINKVQVQLQNLDDDLKKVRVCKFYQNGYLIAHATLGARRIHVRGNLNTIVDNFTNQYLQKRITSC